jgi:hypothetical protein
VHPLPPAAAKSDVQVPAASAPAADTANPLEAAEAAHQVAPGAAAAAASAEAAAEAATVLWLRRLVYMRWCGKCLAHGLFKLGFISHSLPGEDRRSAKSNCNITV